MDSEDIKKYREILTESIGKFQAKNAARRESGWVDPRIQLGKLIARAKDAGWETDFARDPTLPEDLVRFLGTQGDDILTRLG